MRVFTSKWVGFELSNRPGAGKAKGVSFWELLGSTLHSMIFYNSLKDVRLLAQTVY